jgi:tetratricopeptide (TPR) repeat protein
MGAPRWKNIYDLSSDQIEKLEEAEDKMESMEINESEKILLGLLEEDNNCIPVLNILGHLHGRYLSDFEASIEYYDKVLELEPDNAWARDERRRYRRYVSYD